MRRRSTGVFGSKLAVAITASIVTAVVVAGGIASATVPNNSVGSRKIIDNSIRSADIRNGAVKSIDIRNGTVTGADIRNGTVTSADVAAAAVDSWLSTYNQGIFTRAAENSSPPQGNYWTIQLGCPAGSRSLMASGSIGAVSVFMTDSYPLANGEWVVRWESEDDVILTPSFLRMWVLCAPGV